MPSRSLPWCILSSTKLGLWTRESTPAGGCALVSGLSSAKGSRQQDDLAARKPLTDGASESLGGLASLSRTVSLVIFEALPLR